MTTELSTTEPHATDTSNAPEHGPRNYLRDFVENVVRVHDHKQPAEVYGKYLDEYPSTRSQLSSTDRNALRGLALGYFVARVGGLIDLADERAEHDQGEGDAPPNEAAPDKWLSSALAAVVGTVLECSTPTMLPGPLFEQWDEQHTDEAFECFAATVADRALVEIKRLADENSAAPVWDMVAEYTLNAKRAQSRHVEQVQLESFLRSMLGSLGGGDGETSTDE